MAILKSKISGRFIKNIKNRICPNCNILFKPRMNKQIYCSLKCVGNITSKRCNKKIEIVCEQCNKKELVSPFYKNKRFCSSKCYGISLKKPKRIKIKLFHSSYKMCSMCKKFFKVKNYRLEESQFCSRSCHAKFKFSGKNHPKWIKDRTKLAKHQIRNDYSYQEWRKNVWKRDGWKCKIDNCDCNGRIEAHHILGWTNYPELRYEINNGITLCHAHHPRKRAEEKRLIPAFRGLVSVSN